MKQDSEPRDIHQYKDIIATITQLTHSKFGFLNISKELCNIVLIKRLKFASENDDIQKKIETIFSKAVEELFSSYYNDVLQYSLSRTQNLGRPLLSHARRIFRLRFRLKAIAPMYRKSAVFCSPI